MTLNLWQKPIKEGGAVTRFPGMLNIITIISSYFLFFVF